MYKRSLLSSLLFTPRLIHFKTCFLWINPAKGLLISSSSIELHGQWDTGVSGTFRELGLGFPSGVVAIVSCALQETAHVLQILLAFAILWCFFMLLSLVRSCNFEVLVGWLINSLKSVQMRHFQLKPVFVLIIIKRFFFRCSIKPFKVPWINSPHGNGIFKLHNFLLLL